jgi:preprotein translocase subunit SecY
MMAASPRQSQLAGALLVTAAVLIVYRLGLLIPIPGVEPKVAAQLFHAGGTAAARISIFALDIYPLFGILILAELAKVFAPPLRRWEHTASRNRDKLARIVLIVALFSAVLQANGIATALDGIAGLVTEPGLQFRLPAIATLVAGTALVTWLAGQITRRGLGSGLWVIVAAPTLADLPHTIESLHNFQSQGVVSGAAVVWGAVFIVVAVAVVVAVLLAGGRIADTAPACLWPMVLAYTTMPFVLVAISAIARAYGPDGSMPWIELGHPVRLVTLVLLIWLFVVLYVQSCRRADVPVPAVASAVIAAMLAAVALGSEVLPAYLSVPLIVGGQQLLLVAILTTTLLRDWSPYAQTSASADQSSAANR